MAGFAGFSSWGRIATTATMTATKLTALTTMAGPTPQAAMRRPATPGPTSRAELKDALLRPTAFGRRRIGTISETKAWRAGLSKALTMPVSVASTYTCHNSTVSVSTSMASAAPVSAIAACVTTRSCRFGTRSLTAPA